MAARAYPVRWGAGRLARDERPIALPHLEEAPARFLGEPLDIDAAEWALLAACDGRRELAAFPLAERELIQSWYRAGLVLGAPPPRSRPSGLTVVAPHPDDAQLAVGALLAATGARVLDVFTEETWTRRPYYRARPELTSALLLAEERLACRVLDTELTLLGHLDGGNRPAWEDGFLVGSLDRSTILAREPELFARLRDDLAAALRATTGPVLAPLAVGGHVDHVLVHEAVLGLIADGSLAPERVMFYEDMPYSVFTAATEVTGSLEPVLVPTTATHARRKREALWAYRLQVPDGVAARVIRYGNSLAPNGIAERLWVTDAAGFLDRDPMWTSVPGTTGRQP